MSDNTVGGLPVQVAMPVVGLESGDTITFNTNLLAGGGIFEVIVTESPAAAQNGPVASVNAGGSISFSAGAAGSYVFLYQLQGSPNTVRIRVSASCSAGKPGSGSAGGTPAEEKQKITDALVRTADGGRLSNAPGDLPDREDFTPDFIASQAALDEAKQRLDELREARRRVKFLQDKADRRLFEILRDRYKGNREAAEEDPEYASLGDAESEYDETGKALDKQLDEQQAKVSKLEKAADLDIFGEDVLLYAPEPRDPASTMHSKAFWPFFRSADVIRTGGRINGPVFDLWTRMQISAVNGSLGREGTTFNAQIGVVRSLSNNLDGGLFVSVFSGDIRTDGLSSNLDSLGVGAGGYLKFTINDRVKAGISASFERSDNDINIGGATGSFDRDRFTLDVSFSGKRVVKTITVVPSATLSWVNSDRDIYVNNAGILVPGTVDDTLTATTALALSRTFVPDNPSILTVKPNLNFAVNFHLIRFDDVVFADGSQIGYGAVTGTVNGGVDLHFVNGNSLNIAATASGIGGDTQAYGIGAQFRVPLP